MDQYRDDVLRIFESLQSTRAIARKLIEMYPKDFDGTTEDTLKNRVSRILKNEFSDKELMQRSVYFRRRSQKFQDLNRIDRKAFREDDRGVNALEELFKQVRDAIRKHPLPIRKQGRYKIPESGEFGGIIHLADLHFNELVDMPSNKYDFKVASKRLKYFIQECIIYLKGQGITEIVVVNTGDTMNSDRRLDEILSQSTNRAHAAVLGYYILKQLISHLSEHFKINIFSVSGNESRIGKERGYSDVLATDSYDVIINELLRVHFYMDNRVTIHQTAGMEQVFQFKGMNVLILHGECIKPNSNIQKQIQSIFGRYSMKGIMLHFIIYGHHHFTMISDHSGQSSSLVGSNGYSEYALGFNSTPSQNLYIAKHMDMQAIKIPLQNAEQYTDGYEIVEALEAYNAKSNQKIKKQETVFKIVI